MEAAATAAATVGCMHDRVMKRSRAILFAIVLALVGVIVYGVVSHMVLLIRLALADEQTEIFQDMVVKASEALSQSSPDASAAVEYLCYAHRYYPSGTKQVAGSRLDVIVERARSLAEMRIIDMLRKATGKDYGEDAEAWIKAFDKRSDAEHGTGR